MCCISLLQRLSAAVIEAYNVLPNLVSFTVPTPPPPSPHTQQQQKNPFVLAVK